MIDFLYLLLIIVGWLLSYLIFHRGTSEGQSHWAVRTAMATLLADDDLAQTSREGARKSKVEFNSPSPSDVLKAKEILLTRCQLPLEIIDVIIDWAQYWPRTSVSTIKPMSAVGGRSNPKENVFILRSLPLGYCTADAGGDQLSLPLDIYPHMSPTANNFEYSESLEAQNAEILEEWTARSMPRAKHPCRKIVFTLTSRDQGWAHIRDGAGLYEGSYTWFDAGLERLVFLDRSNRSSEDPVPIGFTEQLELNHSNEDETSDANVISCNLRTIQPPITSSPDNSSVTEFNHPFLPPDTRIQSNITGSSNVKEYTITWSTDDCIDPESAEGDGLEERGRGRASATGNFVRNLKVGDIVTVWARARFPMWRNQVSQVKVDVYWAV